MVIFFANFNQACNVLLQNPTDEVLHLHDAHQPQYTATRLTYNVGYVSNMCTVRLQLELS